MITTALIQPAERQYQPTPADFAEQDYYHATNHPDVRGLIAAAREALDVLGYVPGVESTYRRLARWLESHDAR